MAMGGDGPWAITVMWILTLLTLVFVVLRVYTRYVVVQNFGMDDHVYNFAFLLLLAYTVATTVAAYHGFGQNMTEIPDMDDLVQAILFEAIGQTFAVVGMAVAKWSLGLFLLRLVTEAWHKVAIWITMGSLMAASISVCFVFWLQCSPPAYLYDRRIPGGYCYINTTPVSFTLCILCVVADFFFALFPWLFLWKLNMNQREKVVIAASMSLGLFSGACGIKRTVEVPNLSSQNYLKDTVGLIVWSAAEISVTMVCIGIPVCRPLYKNFLNKLTSSFNSTGYKKHNTPSGSALPRNTGGRGLRTIGGGTIPGREREWEENATKGSRSQGEDRSSQEGNGSDESERGVTPVKNNFREGFKEVRLGINGPFTKSKVVSGSAAGGRGGGGIGNGKFGLGTANSSNEEILGESKQQAGYTETDVVTTKRDSRGKSGSKKDRGNGDDNEDIELGQVHIGDRQKEIHVTETWRVTRS